LPRNKDRSSRNTGGADKLRQLAIISDINGNRYADHSLSQEHATETQLGVFPVSVNSEFVHEGSAPASDYEWTQINSSFFATLYEQIVSAAARQGTVLTPTSLSSATAEADYVQNWCEWASMNYGLATVLQAAIDDVAPVFTSMRANLASRKWQILGRLSALAKHPIPPVYRRVIEYYCTPKSAGPNTPYLMCLGIPDSRDQYALNLTDVSQIDATLTAIDTLAANFNTPDALALERAMHTRHPDWSSDWNVALPSVDPTAVYEYKQMGLAYDDPSVGDDSLMYPNRADDGDDILVRFMDSVEPHYMTAFRTTITFAAHHRGTSSVAYGFFRVGLTTGEKPAAIGMFTRNGGFSAEVFNYDADNALSVRFFPHLTNGRRGLDEGAAVTQLHVDPLTPHHFVRVPFREFALNTETVLLREWDIKAPG